MPSRDEIAEWLREASVLLRDSKYEEILEQRASQVEAMRCESCRWYGDSQQCDMHNGYLFGDGGCFLHEQKEER